MQKLSFKVLSIGFCVMFFAIFAMATPPAALAGGLVSVHGHNGHIEFPDEVNSATPFKGWGLDFDQASGKGNWIHYTIPTPIFSETRYLAIKFFTGSVDMKISAFHVYDGYNRIYALDGLTLSGESCKNSWYVIDMGSYKPINSALGLSIAVDAGVERISHRVQIFAIAAEWQGSSQY